MHAESRLGGGLQGVFPPVKGDARKALGQRLHGTSVAGHPSHLVQGKREIQIAGKVLQLIDAALHGRFTTLHGGRETILHKLLVYLQEIKLVNQFVEYYNMHNPTKMQVSNKTRPMPAQGESHRGRKAWSNWKTTEVAK
jgi:hypothetical protein